MEAPKVTNRLISIIERFRILDSEMQAQQMLIFLTVVAKPGLSLREIEQQTGLSLSSVSRNVSALGEFHRKGQPGHNLLVAYEDIHDRRFKKVKPTQKGLIFHRTLVEAITES